MLNGIDDLKRLVFIYVAEIMANLRISAEKEVPMLKSEELKIVKAATRWLLLGVGVVLSVTPCSAQTFTMQAVTDLPTKPAGQVIGGTPADPAKWPATFVFRNSSGGGCTATAIGRQVAITAAHCLENGAKGFISVSSFKASVVCNHHPAYPADISADFALCLIDKQLPKLGNGFERINAKDTEVPTLAEKIILLGYGCTEIGGVDRNFGTLYEGIATVDQRPNKDLYFRTNGAALCFGDSGGGAYYLTNPAGTVRRLFGINSRGDISSNSWISTTSNKSFSDWSRNWGGANNVRICGLDVNAEDCRQ